MNRDYVNIFLNGKQLQVDAKKAFLTLSNFLRKELWETGTKEVCAEGDCGACTVLVGDLKSDPVNYKSINSCITFMFLLDNHSIITIEGLNEKNNQLNEIQQKMIHFQGTQCGYCTPGFVVSMYEMISKREKNVDFETIQNQLQGNLCRCTGLKSIAQAAMNINPSNVKPITDLYPLKNLISPINNETLILNNEVENFHFVAPQLKSDVSSYLDKGYQIIAGSTDLSVPHNKFLTRLTKVISLQNIKDLNQITIDHNYIKVGARVTMNQFVEHPEVQKQFPEFIKFMHQFASKQIKNMATLCGNIINASPVADTVPFLMALDCKINYQGTNTKRTIPIRNLYLDYKKLDRQKDEWIESILIPLRSALDKLFLYKVSKRFHLDISIVNCAYFVEINEHNIINKAHIVYGGIGPYVFHLSQMEKFLVGKKFDELFCYESEIKKFLEQITPISDHRASETYRRLLVLNFWKKFINQSPSLGSCNELTP